MLYLHPKILNRIMHAIKKAMSINLRNDQAHSNYKKTLNMYLTLSLFY